MKKLLSMLLVVVILASCACACAEGGITFRNVPWGSSFTEAKGIIQGIRWLDYSGENHGADTIKDIVGIGSDVKTSNNNINMYAYSSSSTKVTVAGYEVDEMKMYYAFTSANGTVTRTEENTALYAASYKFEPTDIDGVFADLTGKLTFLYGEPTETRHDTNWTNDKYTYVIWNSADGDQVILKMDDERESTWSTGNKIYLFYIWNQADVVLRAADDAVTAEKAGSESQNYGNGNTDGL